MAGFGHYDDTCRDRVSGGYSWSAAQPRSAFNARFPNSWRYWNSLDVVQRAWDNLPDLDQIYDGIGISTPSDVQIVINSMEVALLGSEAWYESAYEQPNAAGTVLKGQPMNPQIGWVLEAAAQHASNTYLGLLGAPVIKANLFTGPGALERGPVLRRPALKKEQVLPRVPRRRRSPRGTRFARVQCPPGFWQSIRPQGATTTALASGNIGSTSFA